ncbi:Disease resistance protein [Macleaya cordata]|uniref:Disease resistance protein n=1 Tax=Macleaya cordata TaxID=56857 RepID=A0A200R806_MACCD|nr:Disease resistance protein [Macleaya cordata]
MAEAAVTFFLERLTNLITEEANLLLGVDEQVRLLRSELKWMSLFIRDADVKRRSDPRVQLWVSELREITFHAEDVIDEFILKIDQHRPQTRNLGGFLRFLKNCMGFTRQSSLLHELGNQIKVINTVTEKISANQSRYCLDSIQASADGSESSYSSNQVKRVPIAEESDMVGIEDGTEQVKLLLMEGGADKQRRIVVSIVGMGGLGKTTLAKKVYNSLDVKKHFDCFAWVYVSQEYRRKELLKGIFKCLIEISKKKLEKMDEEELSKLLHEFLKSNKMKYLIVLDDVWNVRALEDLQSVLPDETNGSRILLTTRNKEVALHLDNFYIHELRFLNEEESRRLFLKKIFPLEGGENSSTQDLKCPPDLEDLIKEMVEKCHGLPLAIVVLGGLLSSKAKTKIAWSKVNASVSWQLTHGAGSNSCLGILALSYYDLPYYLKPCFLYMGLFPEDYEISASKLYQYWIAEGLVQRRGKETMEEVAEDYLEELIHRSMVQVRRWRYDGRVRTCLIHDLLRDLSIAESKNDQFFQVYGSIDDYSEPNNVRRLTIHGGEDDQYNEEEFLAQIRYTRRVRSLLCFSIEVKDKQFWKSLCGGFKLLRVLDLVQVEDIHTLPNEIGELIHLKYLCLQVNGRNQKLPISFSKLVKLQTLNLKWCSFKYMPSQIWNLHQLRYLHLFNLEPLPMNNGCWNVRSTSHFRIDNLTNLHTLHIRLGDWINGFGLGKLRMLKKLVLRGSLEFYMEAISDSIAKLNAIRSLELYECEVVPPLSQFSHHTFLNKLYLDGRLSLKKSPNTTEFVFPPNLHKLSLGNSHIEEDPMEILAKLQNLRILILWSDSYLGKKMVCSNGGFPRLEVLEFSCLENLEEWKLEEGAMTSLTHLKIYKCESMAMLPSEMQQLTALQELNVSKMPEKFMERLTENVGEDWDKIKHIPSVKLKHES